MLAAPTHHHEHNKESIDKSRNAILTRAQCFVSVVAVLLLVSLPSTLLAHELRPAIINLTYSSTQNTIEHNSLNVNMVVNLESLIAGIEPEHDNTNASPNSDRYSKLRSLDENNLKARFEQFQPQFLSKIQLNDANGRPIALELASITIPPVGNIANPRDSTIVLKALLSSDTPALTWQWSDAFGEAIVRANSNSNELEFATLLSPGQQSTLIQFTKSMDQRPWQVFTSYVAIGFEHILPKGMDHILFVVGLFLLTTRWRSLLLQVTVFTVAHSITLALGASGALRVSGSVVEPLIALSIVFVCVENIFTKRLGKWRLILVFFFGLLHGLGFASVLGQVGLDQANFVIALLGFNIGVELGQLLVVALCMAAVGYWFGNKPYYHNVITRPCSIVIGLIGLYWFVQRTIM